MVQYFLLVLFLSIGLKANEVFSFAEEFPLVILNGEEITNAFTGGLNKPKIQWIDHDEDGDIDLFLSDIDGYLRYYENHGNSSNHSFILRKSHFQNISPAGWFSFKDLDLDGDLDIATQNISALWGGYSGVRIYQNTNNEFQILVDTLLTNTGEPLLSAIQSTPTFADIDNDGDEDFFTGSLAGTVTFYENTGMENGIPIYSLITDFWQGLSIIGTITTIDSTRHGASAITFIDLDGDNDLDLSWGDFFQPSLYIIWNIGTPENPYMDIYNIITEYPTMNPIQTTGQNMPTFADLDGDGDQDLFVAVISGAYGTQYIENFYHYINIGSENNPIYEFESNDFFQSLDFYSGAVTEVVDMDNDGNMELLIGTEIDYSISPFRGKIKYFKNTGSLESPVWELVDEDFLGNNIGYNLAPCAGDLDDDGDQDILVGDYNGKIYFYERVGEDPNESSYEFIEELNEIDLSGRSHPELADIDGDGDLDLFIGENWGVIQFYENIGTPENHEFVFVTDSFSDIDIGEYSTPEFLDIDLDGDLDLFVGSLDGAVTFFRNSGTSINPIFIQDNSLIIPYIGASANLSTYHDIDSGEINMIAGVYSGGLYFLKMEQSDSPEISVTYNAGWNLVGVSMNVNSSLYPDVFPESVSGTLFGFNESYTQESELEVGEGYWLFFDESGSQIISGETVDSLTLSLSMGWNLISGISSLINVNQIIDPDNIVIPGTLYGFIDSYIQSNELEPGNGFWINANTSGEILLLSSSLLNQFKLFQPSKTFNTIVQNNTTLYFGGSVYDENIMSFSLPPKPPSGAKDIRFSGDTKLCLIDTCVIEVMNDGQPIIFDCNIKDGEDWEIVDENENVFKCNDIYDIEVNDDSEFFVLRKSTSNSTPTEFTIFPAYPNPFNPVTTISYSVRTNGHLRIKVSDIQGRIVEELVNENISPGNYSVLWDAGGFSSGVYFVKLVFEDYREVQKIIFLK